MKVTDIISNPNENTFSVEVFPPKLGSDYKDFGDIVLRLDAGVAPDWLSVTCGASGTEPRGPDYKILSIARKTISDRPVVAHMTCVCQTEATVAEHLRRLDAVGIHDILALRGDAPIWSKDTSPWCTYHHASDLISAIKKHFRYDFSIGAAAYPEGHPETPLYDKNLDHLKIKQDSGADYLVTQMFFDNDQFYRWLNTVRRAGITIPIVAGVMPIFNADRVSKMCKLSNARLSGNLKNIIDHFGEHPREMFAAGIIYTCNQIVDLIANGVKSIHLYTMNKPEIAFTVCKYLDGLL